MTVLSSLIVENPVPVIVSVVFVIGETQLGEMSVTVAVAA